MWASSCSGVAVASPSRSARALTSSASLALGDELGGEQETVVGVDDPESGLGRWIEHPAGQGRHPHVGVEIEPGLGEASLAPECLGLVEHDGVATERVDALGEAPTADSGGCDGGAPDDEDRGCDSTVAQPCVQFGEEFSGLLGTELVAASPRHAVTRSRSGT